MAHYKQNYSVGKYTVGSVIVVSFLLLNASFDLTLFCTLLMPELPEIISNCGYDNIEPIHRNSNSEYPRLPFTKCMVKVSDFGAIYFMLFFTVFLFVTFILLVTVLKTDDATNKVNYNIRSWFTISF